MQETIFQGQRMDNGEWVEGWYMPRPNLSKEYIVSVDNAVWCEVKPGTVRPIE